MDITEFLDRLDGVAGGNNQYSARCPAHCIATQGARRRIFWRQ